MRRGLELGIAMMFVTAMACSKENAVEAGKTIPGGIGSECSGANDPGCGLAAVCVLGYCRSGCTNDAECPQGSLCIGDTPPYGCQLPQDSVCNDTDKKCSAPLVCGMDKTCRMPCTVSKDCPRNEHQCHAGVCVGDSEKGDAAIAYRSCEDGLLRCGTGTDPCVVGACEVQGCNMTAPGWAPVQACNGATPFCAEKKCVGIQPEDPGPLVQIPSPPGGTYGIDKTEVTRAQYARFLIEKGTDLSDQPAECASNATYAPTMEWPPVDKPHHPVAYVDWCDAFAYCKWAGKRLCGRIGGGAITHEQAANANESQWYNACASGAKDNDYPYGNTVDETRCSFGGDPVECGSLPGCQSSEAGYAGVFDLMGNVAEWEDSCVSESCLLRGGGCAAPKPCPEVEPAGRLEYGSGAVRVGFRCCSQ